MKLLLKFELYMTETIPRRFLGLVLISYQNVFFIMEWFSSDRVQCPRKRSLQETSRGKTETNASFIIVGINDCTASGKATADPISSIFVMFGFPNCSIKRFV